MMQKKVILILLVYLFLTSIGEATEQNTLNPKDQKALTATVASVVEKVKKTEATVPANRFAEEGKKRAQQTADVFKTPEFQGSIKREQQRLDNEVFKKYTQKHPETCEKKQEEKSPDSIEANEQQKIYLFISSSLPDETMHSYLLDISRANADSVLIVPVMRGMVNGIADKKANRNYFSRILKEDMSCIDNFLQQEVCERFKTNILFQPPLLKKYTIDQVPALVYDNDNQIYIIQGDASLDFLLERVNREAKQKSLEILIAKIRGGINE